MLRIDFAGQELHLLPQRAIWWPAESTLFIADLHLGKAATFRAAGVPVPAGTTASDLSRLDQLIFHHSARRLVVLGDLIHAPEGRAQSTMAAVSAWAARHGNMEKILIRGNHDRAAGDPPPQWGFACQDGPVSLGGLTLAHDPSGTRKSRRLLAGHLHPAAVLERADGRAGGMRVPCFWVSPGRSARDALLVLPAFGAFTGMRAIRPRPGDRIFAVGPQHVVEVPSTSAAAQAVTGPWTPPA